MARVSLSDERDVRAFMSARVCEPHPAAQAHSLENRSTNGSCEPKNEQLVRRNENRTSDAHGAIFEDDFRNARRPSPSTYLLG